MKKYAFFLLLISILVVLLGYIIALFSVCSNVISTYSIYCADMSSLFPFYQENIRGHLFAGFLALGGFLLSLKTFIVVNMKDNVYDDDKYQENWRNQLKKNPDLKLYAPLKELSNLLFYAIMASILSAVLQMTLGLYPHWLASLFCIWSALYATILLVSSLILIKKNLDTWFEYLDK